MTLPSDCDIAIIGAGPVGLFLANLMGLAGHRVVLLERNEGLCPLLRAAYLVACDGGGSATRERIGAKLEGATFAQKWLVIDAIVPGHEVRAVTFGCDPARPSVLVPSAGDRLRWEFLQLPGEDEATL